MSVAPTQEQDDLRDAARRFLSARSTSEQVRVLLDGDEGGDPAVWAQLAGQLGLASLVVPEEHGGAGAGAIELGIVMEEMGRALLVSPFASTVALGVQALLVAAEPQAQARWLPGLADGSRTATLAVAEESGSWDLGDVRCKAGAVPGGWRLSGTKAFVTDGCTADLLLVVADAEDGLGLFAVDGTADGVTRSRSTALDLTRPLARLELHDVPAERVSGQGDARDALDRALQHAVVALAAEQVGGAQRCLDMAVEHARTRVQFDRPIGSFQAIKHLCADLLLQVEQARSAAQYAASVVDGPTAEAAIAAAVAAAYCSEAYTAVAKASIQVHGGIGFTWEHDAHLHLRRAKSSELLLGSPTRHRTRLAELLGIAP